VDLSNLFLDAMTKDGPMTLSLAMFLGTLGIPVPLPILALAAGAFARYGMVNWGLTSFLALAGATLGDSLGFVVGRFAGAWAYRRYGDSPAWAKARGRFRRNGGLAIYITRFLLTPLAVPTNLIAGGSDYSYPRFLAYTVAGTSTFILVFGGMGYVFGKEWKAIADYLTIYVNWLAGLCIAAIAVYLLIRYLRGTR
jgi:membrane-associated protein